MQYRYLVNFQHDTGILVFPHFHIVLRQYWVFSNVLPSKYVNRMFLSEFCKYLGSGGSYHVLDDGFSFDS